MAMRPLRLLMSFIFQGLKYPRRALAVAMLLLVVGGFAAAVVVTQITGDERSTITLVNTDEIDTPSTGALPRIWVAEDRIIIDRSKMAAWRDDKVEVLDDEISTSSISLSPVVALENRIKEHPVNDEETGRELAELRSELRDLRFIEKVSSEKWQESDIGRVEVLFDEDVTHGVATQLLAELTQAKFRRIWHVVRADGHDVALPLLADPRLREPEDGPCGLERNPVCGQLGVHLSDRGVSVRVAHHYAVEDCAFDSLVFEHKLVGMDGAGDLDAFVDESSGVRDHPESKRPSNWYSAFIVPDTSTCPAVPRAGEVIDAEALVEFLSTVEEETEPFCCSAVISADDGIPWREVAEVDALLRREFDVERIIPTSYGYYAISDEALSEEETCKRAYVLD